MAKSRKKPRKLSKQQEIAREILVLVSNYRAVDALGGIERALGLLVNDTYGNDHLGPCLMLLIEDWKLEHGLTAPKSSSKITIDTPSPSKGVN